MQKINSLTSLVKLLLFISAFAMAKSDLHTHGKSEHGHAKKHSHKAHSHGLMKLNVGLEASQLEVEIEVPSLHILGTESKKLSPQEIMAEKSIAVKFKDPSAFLVLPANANCVWNTFEYEFDSHGDHSDFDLEYKASCKNLPNLKTMEWKWNTFVEAFSKNANIKFVPVQVTEVNIVTEQAQKSFKLEAKKSAIEIQ